MEKAVSEGQKPEWRMEEPVTRTVRKGREVAPRSYLHGNSRSGVGGSWVGEGVQGF